MTREREWPSWSIAPFGAVFTVVELTHGSTPPCFKRKLNDKSRINQNCFDLWGMAAIGEIFRFSGGLSLMDSHSTTPFQPLLL